MRLVGLRRGAARVVHRVGTTDGGVPHVVAALARAGGGEPGAGSTGVWRAGRDDGTTVELVLTPDGELLEVDATLRGGLEDAGAIVVSGRTAGRPVFSRGEWADERRRVEPIAVHAVRTPLDELELRVGPERAGPARSCWVAGNLQVLVAGDGRVRGVRVGPLTAAEWGALGR